MNIKTYIPIIIMLVLIMMFALPVYAGVWDTVQEHAVLGLISVVSTLVAAIFGKKWAAIKAPLQDLLEAVFRYRDAKKADSEGGKTVTKNEWNAIYKEIQEALDGIVKVIPESWLPANKTAAT